MTLVKALREALADALEVLDRVQDAEWRATDPELYSDIMRLRTRARMLLQRNHSAGSR
jgi:hypothetical protein